MKNFLVYMLKHLPAIMLSSFAALGLTAMFFPIIVMPGVLPATIPLWIKLINSTLFCAFYFGILEKSVTPYLFPETIKKEV